MRTQPGNHGYATVRSFDPSAPPIDIPLVDAVVAWVNQTTCQVHLLHFEKVLYVESMQHHLLSPFILREAGYIVNETARIHTHDNDLHNNTHCIIGIDENKPLRIPLELYGSFSYFDVIVPAGSDFDTPEERRHIMTPNFEWNPNVEHYAEAESSYLDHTYNLISQFTENKALFDTANDPRTQLV